MSFIQSLLAKRKQMESGQVVNTQPTGPSAPPVVPSDEGLAQQMLQEDQYRLRPQFNQPPRNY